MEKIKSKKRMAGTDEYMAAKALASAFLSSRIDKARGLSTSDDIKALRKILQRTLVLLDRNGTPVGGFMEMVADFLISETVVAAFCVEDEGNFEGCPMCGEKEDIHDINRDTSPTGVDPLTPAHECTECGYTFGSAWREHTKEGAPVEIDFNNNKEEEPKSPEQMLEAYKNIVEQTTEGE